VSLIESAVQDFFPSLSEGAITSLTDLLTVEKPDLRYSAARMLKDLGRADERVVNALLSCLTAEDPKLCINAARLLSGLMESDNSLGETVLSKTQPQSSEAIAACWRVMSKQSLDESDGKALADLVRLRPVDTNEQRGAREALFGWLWEKLEPKERRVE
jgi:hypothetical protein